MRYVPKVRGNTLGFGVQIILSFFWYNKPPPTSFKNSQRHSDEAADSNLSLIAVFDVDRSARKPISYRLFSQFIPQFSLSFYFFLTMGLHSLVKSLYIDTFCSSHQCCFRRRRQKKTMGKKNNGCVKYKRSFILKFLAVSAAFVPDTIFPFFLSFSFVVSLSP